MKDLLAEKLLARVLGWNSEDIARERPILQAMASLKYDEYQQFSPGMRFVESLALWLSQFRTTEERRTAYNWFRRRLIFCSSAEMTHLVTLVYPDHVRPHLIRKSAVAAGCREYQISKIVDSTEFQLRRRQTLFLGLSDGARIDVFRRSNPELSHEQVRPSHEIAPDRADKLAEDLRNDLSKVLGRPATEQDGRFRTLVLLDDFSASGISYVTRKDSGSYVGKIGSFFHSITKPGSAVARLVDPAETEILVVLYMATEKAIDHLRPLLDEMWGSVGIHCSLDPVYPLPEHSVIRKGDDPALDVLVQAYYDPAVETEHTARGGTDDVRYGFAGCGLPVILHHNTPNNSLSLLWAETDKVRALFPRVSRHK